MLDAAVTQEFLGPHLHVDPVEPAICLAKFEFCTFLSEFLRIGIYKKGNLPTIAS